MKKKYGIKLALISWCFFETTVFSTYDQTFIGYGTSIAYQGYYNDVLLDPNAQTNEGATVSPYGIVTVGGCIFKTSVLPNYPNLGLLPCISRFNRDGTPDTNFGNFFPGTGSYTFDPSTNLSFPNFENVNSQFGKLVYMYQSGSFPTYFLVYKNGNSVANCSIYKYMPITGRIDYNFNEIGMQNIALQDNLGNPLTATITSACSVPVSGSMQTSAQTTSDIYITYYDGSGNSYIAALTYSLTTNLFTYDATFATHGVVKFATGTGGAGTIHFNAINYDSIANAGAGALIVSGVTGNGNIIIARYKNLITGVTLDTSFHTTGYAIVAAPGGSTPAIMSQFIFSKIVSTGTHYYYCAGWNATGPVLDVCSFNPATASFGALSTVSTAASGHNYHIYDMVQIPDFSGTNAVAVAVGANYSGQPTLAGIIDFQFESPTQDLTGNAVALTEINSQNAIGQSSVNLAFYSCLFDPSLYAAASINLPGIFVGGNFGTLNDGCFTNFAYSSLTHSMTPAAGACTGTCLFDYVNSQYSDGFSFQQVFSSSASGRASYYISGQALDVSANPYAGIFCFDITNNSFWYTL